MTAAAADGAPASASPLGAARFLRRPAALGSQSQSVSLALSNLRGLAILLVVAIHASVAYLASAPAQPRFDQPPYLWVAFSVVDTRRWLGLDIFCASQDIYLMGLLFFLSGLFGFAGVERDGAAKFLRRRFIRLGLPLIFGVAVVMPIALYPTFRLTAVDPSLAAYASAYLALPFEPCGPMWFLGVLLGLTLAAVAMHALLRRTILRVGELSQAFEHRPTRAFVVWALASIVVYAPLALAFTPFLWIDKGPFALQLSRPGLYALYYGAGLCVGAGGLDAGMLRPDGRFARLWKQWMAAAALSLLAWMGMMGLAIHLGGAAPWPVALAADACYGLACASGVLFVLSICLRFGAARPWPLLARLSDNAFGVYVLHYAPVVWLQYTLLDANWPAPIKALVVLVGAIVACLAAMAVFRRMQTIALVRRSPAAAPSR